MTARSQSIWRGAGRAAAGIVVIAAVAVGAFALENTSLPSIEADHVSVTVDTLHGAEQHLVCPGSFSELGADPTRPGVAIPLGTAQTAAAGDVEGASELSRKEQGGSLPDVFSGKAATALAAAQVQLVESDLMRGVSAAGCYEPRHEQWLVGGATTLGTFTTLSLGNPTSVPATVSIALFDENGPVDDAATTTVLVPAKSERTVSLNGYAPARESLAVQVVSTGAAITSSLGVAEVQSINPFAVDTVSRQLSPETTLMFAGVTNFSIFETGGPGDAGDLDRYPVVVRTFAPGGESGSATIRAVYSDGSTETLGNISFDAAHAVVDTPIPHWPDDARALIVDADVPIFGAVFSSYDDTDASEHDYAWFAPAPVLPADTEIAAAIVPGGQLVLVNPSSEPVTITIRDANGETDDQTVTLPAGAAVPVNAPAAVILEADRAFAAGVRVTTSGIAGYPIVAPVDRASTLTVFTR